MNDYVKKIESLMTDEAKEMLKGIYKPTVVATPLSDSRRDICIMPDGEIRSYGVLEGSGRGAYLASRNGGLSWDIHYASGNVNACSYFEKEDINIALSL